MQVVLHEANPAAHARFARVARPIRRDPPVVLTCQIKPQRLAIGRHRLEIGNQIMSGHRWPRHSGHGKNLKIRRAIRPDTTFEPGDWREHYFSGGRKQEVYERVERLRFLEHDGMDLPEAALRFCLSHPAVSTVIPGMRSPRRAEQNVKAGDGKALSRQDLQALKAHEWPRNFYRDE